MIFLLICLLPLGSNGDDGWRVVGGEVAKSAQFPYFVSLQDEGSHTCGGAIIDANTVVTAAHCFKYNESPETWSVLVGSPNIAISSRIPKESRYEVSSIQRHTKYDSQKSGFYDIAVMKTKQKIQFDDKVQPIQLSDMEDRPQTGVTCRVMGYGYTDSYSGTADIVLTIPMDIQEKSFCSKLYHKDVTDEHICAGGETYRGVCRGDSGGPLVCEKDGRTRIYGVTSYTRNPCGQWHSPGVFTRVGFYADWIKGKME